MIDLRKNKFYLFILVYLLIISCESKTRNGNKNGFIERGLIKAGQFNLDYEIISDEKEELIDIVQFEPPSFPGGNDSLEKYIKKKLIYPKSAIADSIQGIVKIEFIVNKNGEIENLQLLEKLNDDIDSVSLNIFKSMPNWKPGYAKVNGKTYASKLILPLKFSLK